jgi:hypothetical protein
MRRGRGAPGACGPRVKSARDSQGSDPAAVSEHERFARPRTSCADGRHFIKLSGAQSSRRERCNFVHAEMPSPAPQVGPIQHFMVEDHVRLDRLLAASESTLTPDGARGAIDSFVYAQFRRDLLRHIAMEEKVLLPYARSKRGGDPLPIALALRTDHGQLAKLLVRSPTPAILDAVRELLGRHNPFEEGPRGLYAICDALAGDEAPTLVAQLRAQPTVPVAKYYDGPFQERR